MGVAMRLYYLLIAFDILAAVLMGVVAARGHWMASPFLFLATVAINFFVMMSARRGRPISNGKGKRAIVRLAYALIVVAVLNSLAFMGGWSWMSFGGVVGPLLISSALFVFAGRVNSA
jgi:uncharacterized membrane protein